MKIGTPYKINRNYLLVNCLVDNIFSCCTIIAQTELTVQKESVSPVWLTALAKYADDKKNEDKSYILCRYM